MLLLNEISIPIQRGEGEGGRRKVHNANYLSKRWASIYEQAISYLKKEVRYHVQTAAILEFTFIKKTSENHQKLQKSVIKAIKWCKMT